MFEETRNNHIIWYVTKKQNLLSRAALIFHVEKKIKVEFGIYL